MINEGNYYLLTIDNKTRKERTYRIECMKGVELTGIAREGEDIFRQIDLRTYAQRVFGIHYSMDAIHEAIANDTQISFKYFNYDINKKRVFRKKGATYRLSPFAMIYTDDNYYLLAFDPEVKEIRPFRVDRMDGVNVFKAKRVVRKNLRRST